MLAFIQRRKYWLAGIVALMLVWLLWPDRSLARVRALRAELAGDAGRALPQDEREKKGQELRAAMQKLSSSQRGELAADFRQRSTEQLERYHQMSSAEKKKELDRQIDRMEEMRKRMQQQPPGTGNQRTGGPGGFGGGGPGGQSRPNTPEDRERLRQQRLDNSTPRERELRDLQRRDLEQRRRERGLPPTPPGPPRGGRR